MSSLKKCKRIEGIVSRLFENRRKCWLFKMKFHLVDHLSDLLEKLHSIKVSDAAPYEHNNVVLKGAYYRIFMSRATRTSDTAYALKPIVYGLKTNGRDGFRIDQSSVKTKQLQILGEAERSLPNDGLKIPLNKLSTININGISRDVVSKSAPMETLREPSSTNGVHKLASCIKPQTNEARDWIEHGEIVLKFVKSAWICWYSVLTLQYYDWRGKTAIFKDEMLQENYG